MTADNSASRRTKNCAAALFIANGAGLWYTESAAQTAVCRPLNHFSERGLPR